MCGSVRRGEAEPLPVRGWAAEAAVRCVVRITMLLSTLISAEPWKRNRRPPARARTRKALDWSVSFRNLFS
jgi:hypothetical protein